MTEGPAWRFVASQPWAITPEALGDVMAVAGRYNDDPEAVAARLGRPLDNTRAVTVREGGVAVIPVKGVVSRYANVFQQISGGTSIQVLASDFQEALDNPQVRAIVLDIDSPGGQVNGVGELAGRIHAARDRKPVVSYVGHQASSAAYYLASAAERVVISPAAMVGSIGTVLTLDTRKRQGEVTVVSSVSPNKAPDPTTDEGLEQYRKVVNSLAEVFVADVARFRGTTPEAVVSRYGAGGVLVGRDAVEAGMADETGDFESLVASLAGKNPPKNNFFSVNAGPAGDNRGVSPKMKKRDFLAWLFGGSDAASLDAEIPVDAAAAVAGVAQPEPKVDVEALAEQKARELLDQTVRRNAGVKAAAYFDGLVRAERATPAERAAFVTLYADALAADSLNPLPGVSRLGSLKERYEARAAAGFTRDHIPADANASTVQAALKGLKALPSAAASADEAAQVKELQSLQRLLSGTPEGKKYLAEKGVPAVASFAAR